MTHTAATAPHTPVALATPEDMQILEQLTLATAPYMRGTRDYLAALYQRMGTAAALIESEPAPVPLVMEDLERLQQVLDALAISAWHICRAHPLREEGRLLLRRLYISLGRNRALCSPGPRPAARQALPAHQPNPTPALTH